MWGYSSRLCIPTLLITIVILNISSIKTIEYKYKNRKRPTDNRTDRHTDRHIILPLRGFEPVSCGRMHCAQLQSALLLWQNSDAGNQTERYTDRQTNGHIISTGPHWGPLYLSVGINALRRWTPTLEINTDTKIEKGLRTTVLMDRRTYILYC